jgi:hypothetical protein
METYELIENAPEKLGRIAQLWSWSSNYDYPSPATVFIDLIGYSEEEYGEPLTTMQEAVRVLGFLELGILAEALNEYIDRPEDARNFIRDLIEAEGR